MSSSEIRQYIQELAEQERSKLKITSEVMHKFGTQYHYSFKEWGRIVSEILKIYQSSLKTSPNINWEEPDIICSSYVEEPEIKGAFICPQETRIEKEAVPQQAEPEKFTISEIDYSSLEKKGVYKITFSDTYILSDVLLKDVFHRILQHIGFIRVKELEITIKDKPLISYVHENPFSYEKYMSCSSYYIYKLNEREILEVTYEIIKRTNTLVILEKNDNIIFKSFINVNDEKEPRLKVVVESTKTSLVDKTKELDLSKFKHKDILPFSTEEKAILTNENKKLETKENITSSSQTTNTLTSDARFYNFKDLSKYVGMIRLVRIRSIKSDAAPHKPIFLLTLIELIAEGYIEENHFMLDNIMRHVFECLWIKHNPNDKFKAKIEYPFVYLASSPIWKLVLVKENDMPDPTNADICRKVRYGSLDQIFFNLLRIDDNRSFMKDFIIEYFKLKP